MNQGAAVYKPPRKRRRIEKRRSLLKTAIWKAPLLDEDGGLESAAPW
jgi:hypothetical protein